MELWQAILLGSQIRGKANGYLYDADTKTSCALGASIEAVVGTDEFTREDFWAWTVLHTQWPWVNKKVVACPECARTNDVADLIVHLNNTTGHDWTRERIALEFVRPIEESLVKKESAVEVEESHAKAK